MDYKQYIAQKIDVEGVSSEEIASMVNIPPDPAMGDYALPCFRFAKALRKSPVQIAEALASAIAPDEVIAHVSALNGYLNFKVNKQGLAADVLGRIAREGAEGFIAIEERINAELWAQRCIIATGGSVVYGDRAMRHLKEIGKVVYLKLDAGEVCRRLRAKNPLDVPAETFNRETENYCRESLRRAHFAEGAETARDLLGESAGADFMRNMDAAFDGNASPETLRALIAEMLRALETLRKKFSP